MKIRYSIAAVVLLTGCASPPSTTQVSPPGHATTDDIPHRAAAEHALLSPRPPATSYENSRDRQPSRAQQRSDRPAEPSREVVLHALGLIGAPYRYGGSSPHQGFDCSGFVRYVYRQAGIALPRTTEAMSEMGRPLRLAEIAPGDLVFFDTRRKPFSHVGIYIGDKQFIHAPASGAAVQIVDMRARYWHTRYMGARRVAF